MQPINISFWLPAGEAAGLKRVHRDPSEACKRVVRAALYRQRSREERIAIKKRLRANADAIREQKRTAETLGADQRARDVGL